MCADRAREGGNIFDDTDNFRRLNAAEWAHLIDRLGDDAVPREYRRSMIVSQARRLASDQVRPRMRLNDRRALTHPTGSKLDQLEPGQLAKAVKLALSLERGCGMSKAKAIVEAVKTVKAEAAEKISKEK